jgi:hypothetical protein
LRLNESTELELFIMKGHPERPSPEAYGLRHWRLKRGVRDLEPSRQFPYS